VEKPANDAPDRDPPDRRAPSPPTEITLRRWRKAGFGESLQARLNGLPLRTLIEYVRWRLLMRERIVGSTVVHFYFDRLGHLRQTSTSETVEGAAIEEKGAVVPKPRTEGALGDWPARGGEGTA